ncbi:MAG: penicillin-binding protein 2 [Candidatus Brocadiaceae bacterium]|nr:penicillin-binding protein 2 [Candidatus Brocadiaceae bacterium]
MAFHLGQIQLVDHDKFITLAKVQQYKKISLPARRGLILDRNGNKLAESLRVGSIYADPAMINNPSSVASQLSGVLKLNHAKLTERLGKKKRFVWIKRKTSDEEIKAVEKLSLKGIHITHEYRRFYPNEQLGSHIIGFTGIDEKGLEGIELSCDTILSGEPGYKLIVRDAKQDQIVTPNADIVLPKYGDNIVLTIDATIQRFTEEELQVACEKWKPLSATAIVMNPMTGEVLSMANYPTYNPNHFKKYPPGAKKNLAISDCYEPGSIMKPLIVSGLFEHDLKKPDDVIFCNNGVYKIGGRTLHDAHHGFGELTVCKIISYSSNIGMAKLGMEMGVERMYQHLRNFNFGEKPGIGLPGEISGILRPLREWSVKYSLISISMGHEIAVTPLQFITAFSSIPNGGLLLKPKIIKSILGSDGKIRDISSGPEIIRRVMSANVARDMMNPILVDAVKEGTGKQANLLEYDVAGKTGTAQKTVGKGGLYSHDKYVGSFVAYAPAENPRFCVLVMLNEPQGKYYGGTVAAPVVASILNRSLQYIGVKSSRYQMAMQ